MPVCKVNIYLREMKFPMKGNKRADSTLASENFYLYRIFQGRINNKSWSNFMCHQGLDGLNGLMRSLSLRNRLQKEIFKILLQPSFILFKQDQDHLPSIPYEDANS
jgi:hypothetical protein